MPIHPRGAALPQYLQGFLGAFGVGSDQDELAFVIERRGVGLDHIVRQVLIGKMSFKGPNNGKQIGFDLSQTPRLNRARTEDARLFRHYGLIINSVFKSRGGQSLDGFVQVPRAVEYPNNGNHGRPQR